MRKLWREPLLGFLAAGAALLWFFRTPEPPAPTRVISTDAALFAEALALGLPEHPQFRQPLIDAMRLRGRDLLSASVNVETQAVLDYYHAHREEFTEPPRITFSQRLFQDPTEARTALPDAETSGEPFLYGNEFDMPIDDLSSLFGRDFAAALWTLPANELWQGPIESAYGHHLVLVQHREPEATLAFEAVERQIRQKLSELQLQRLEDAWLAQLVEKHTR